jgi:hypothetical protein
MSGGATQQGQAPSFEQWSMGKDFGRGEAADDARAGALVQYNQLMGGDRPYGTNIQGITPGQNAGSVNLNGQEWMRSGLSPSQITEGRFNLSGLDPSMYQYSPEYGHLIRGDAAQGLNQQAGQIAAQDKQGGLTNAIQGAFDKGAGVFAMGLGGMAGALGGAFPGFDPISGASIPAGQSGILSQFGMNNPFSDYIGGDGGADSGGWSNDMSGSDAGGVFENMYNDYANPNFSDGFNIPGGQGELDTFMNGLQGEMLNPTSSLGQFFPSAVQGTGAASLASRLLNTLGSGASGANGLRNLGLLGGGALGGLSSLLNPTESTQTSTSQTTNTPTATPEAQGFLNSYLSGGPNPYLNQTTQVGSNPYAGQNPYFEDVLKRSMNDVSGRINSQFNGNAWGGSGHQETLSRALADAGTAARMQDYGMQQQLSEADINRRSLYGAGDLNRNAALYSTDMQNKLRAAALGVGGTSSSTTTGPNPYQPSMFGNVVGGGMLGAGLLPWIFGNGGK